MENSHKDKLIINGNIYKKINGKWTIVEKSNVVNSTSNDELTVKWIILEKSDVVNYNGKHIKRFMMN